MFHCHCMPRYPRKRVHFLDQSRHRWSIRPLDGQEMLLLTPLLYIVSLDILMVCVSPSVGYPSCRQTTLASVKFHPSLVTVPHWLLMHISTHPSFELLPSTSLTSPSSHPALRKCYYRIKWIFLMFSMLVSTPNPHTQPKCLHYTLLSMTVSKAVFLYQHSTTWTPCVDVTP